jgi:hypothetical protein
LKKDLFCNNSLLAENFFKYSGTDGYPAPIFEKLFMLHKKIVKIYLKYSNAKDPFNTLKERKYVEYIKFRYIRKENLTYQDFSSNHKYQCQIPQRIIWDSKTKLHLQYPRKWKPKILQ